jgi:hypothetical protein
MSLDERWFALAVSTVDLKTSPLAVFATMTKVEKLVVDYTQ